MLLCGWLGKGQLGFALVLCDLVTLVYGRENGHTNHTVCWNDLAGEASFPFLLLLLLLI